LMRALHHEWLNRESDNEREDDKRDTSTNNIYGVFVPSIQAWISGVFLMSVTHVSLSLTGCGKPVDANNMAGIFRTAWMPESRQDAQKGCPARPQRAKRRSVRFGTLSLWAMRERRWRTFSASC
jgi:hypothetical protein